MFIKQTTQQKDAFFSQFQKWEDTSIFLDCLLCAYTIWLDIGATDIKICYYDNY